MDYVYQVLRASEWKVTQITYIRGEHGSSELDHECREREVVRKDACIGNNLVSPSHRCLIHSRVREKTDRGAHNLVANSFFHLFQYSSSSRQPTRFPQFYIFHCSWRSGSVPTHLILPNFLTSNGKSTPPLRPRGKSSLFVYKS